MTNEIRATYRIVTPMFCSGANQQQAEVRLPSFKGALRFWWRALMWRETQDVGKLLQRESELFGSSEQSIGQSRLRLRLVEDKTWQPIEKGEIFERGQLSGAHYLGYGVMEAFRSRNRNTEAGQLTRPMIPGGEFTIQVRFMAGLKSEQRNEVRNALILLGTVGGIGSKSRKGYGSLTLTRLANDDDSVSLSEDPGERLRLVLGRLEPDPEAPLPVWTAWSGRSRVVAIPGGSARAVDVLNKIGLEMVHFRSWGKDGKVLGKASERNFREDHDLSKKLPASIEHPKRVAFGLPHNYGKKDNEQVQPASKELDRRASPLFLHVHQVSDDSPAIGVAAFLPARFLPENERLRSFGETVSLDTTQGFWEPIMEYLNRLQGQEVPLG